MPYFSSEKRWRGVDPLALLLQAYSEERNGKSFVAPRTNGFLQKDFPNGLIFFSLRGFVS